MANIDLQLAEKVVKGVNSQAGLGFLEYYDIHNVFHPGWDINVGVGNQDLGLPIVSPAKGKVLFVSRKAANGGFGLHLVIFHEDLGLYSHYLHLDNCVVKQGDLINKGQYIANVGNTGTGYAHLHLEVWNESHQQEMRTKGYQFYPTGQTKDWVKQRYVNPSILIKKGQEQLDLKVEPNIVSINLLKIKNSPEIYLVGKDGKYHHIENEEVFKAIFGDFKDIDWSIGEKPSPEEISFSIIGK